MAYEPLDNEPISQVGMRNNLTTSRIGKVLLEKSRNSIGALAEVGKAIGRLGMTGVSWGASSLIKKYEDSCKQLHLDDPRTLDQHDTDPPDNPLQTS
ncbi:hypothetical protein H0V99_02865 [Candidatus Saccharibacteria bacterium]|nr:hypothetical protein [Candidatus Saccharibacteria bacterium]